MSSAAATTTTTNTATARVTVATAAEAAAAVAAAAAAAVAVPIDARRGNKMKRMAAGSGGPRALLRRRRSSSSLSNNLLQHQQRQFQRQRNQQQQRQRHRRTMEHKNPHLGSSSSSLGSSSTLSTLHRPRGQQHQQRRPLLLSSTVSSTTNYHHSGTTRSEPMMMLSSSFSSSTSAASIENHQQHQSSSNNVSAQQQNSAANPPPPPPPPLQRLTEEVKSQSDGLSSSSSTSSPSSSSSSSSPVSSVSKDDMYQIENKRRRLSDVKIREILKSKHSYRWVDPVILETATVQDAIVTTIDGGLSAMMVLADPNKNNNNNNNTMTSTSETNGSGSTSGDPNRVVGLLTSRDLLRVMAAGIREGRKKQRTGNDSHNVDSNNDENSILQREIGMYMTPISQVIYARPEETVGMCRTIMAKLGIKCLPILSRNGQVEGLITARDMSDYGLTAKDKGGKQSYLQDVSQRVGLSSYHTSMAEPPIFIREAHLALDQNPLFVNVGTAALPHPFKTKHAVGRNRKEIGQSHYAYDLDLSEDAQFVTEVRIQPDADDNDNNDASSSSYRRTPPTPRTLTYLGVADGVGSWREYGVDPRQFSRRLMSECENIIQETAATQSTTSSSVSPSASSSSSSTTMTTNGYFGSSSSSSTSYFSGGGRGRGRVGVGSLSGMSPAEIMSRAHDRVCSDDIIGSCTACIALFDGIRHQLHFSNLGDSGIIVLRHIDSDVAGSLKRDRKTPRIERRSDLQLAFVSQQQLKSFNHPYQLGWIGDLEHHHHDTGDNESIFNSASDSCTTSIYLRRGDVVIMATDGLFDNVDVDDICNIAFEWEQTHGFVRGGDIEAREQRWAMGNSLTTISAESVDELAMLLCNKARENSLNNEVDSPFAILAKENDIMWSGGMPDDCTVIVMHVVGRNVYDRTDQFNK